MATPHQSENFADLISPEIKRVFHDRYKELPDRVGEFYSVEDTGPRKDQTTWSGVGTVGDFTEFDGKVNYQSQSQGYDTTATHVELVNGMQIERQLVDDDLTHIMTGRPKALASSAHRTRQKHAARTFVNAFSNDNYFAVNTEGVALCSDSHTTTSGASTTSGFDNLLTAGLTAAAVGAAHTQMRGFRGDKAERISVMPNELIVPIDLEDKALEIVNSTHDPASANNAVNPQHGRFTVKDWNYLTDANDWFLADSMMRGDMLHWVDRIALEFGEVKDFDTFAAKFRAYMRYSNAHTDWRWIAGAQVS